MTEDKEGVEMMRLTFFVLEDVVVLPEDGHTPPALLPSVLLLHHVVGPKALHAASLLRDGGVGHHQGGTKPKVEIVTVPGVREETLRTCGKMLLSSYVEHCHNFPAIYIK